MACHVCAELVDHLGGVWDEEVAGNRVTFRPKGTVAHAAIQPVAVDVEHSCQAPEGPFAVDLLLTSELVAERGLAVE